MVVDDVGRFVTQRQLPAMACIRVSLDHDALVLAHPGVEQLRVALAARQQERLSVYVWEDRCDALDEGGEARDWLGAVLGELRGSRLDRKSTRLNSSHVRISYAVFCLKK